MGGKPRGRGGNAGVCREIHAKASLERTVGIQPDDCGISNQVKLAVLSLALASSETEGLGTRGRAKHRKANRLFQRTRLATIGSGTWVLVTDVVGTSASAQNTHNFIRTVL